MKTTAILATSALFINPAKSEQKCYTRYVADDLDCELKNIDPRCGPDGNLAAILNSPSFVNGASYHLRPCNQIRNTQMDLPMACYYEMESRWHYNAGHRRETKYEGQIISCERICKDQTAVTLSGESGIHEYIDCGVNVVRWQWSYARDTEEVWHCVCAWNQEDPSIYSRIESMPPPTPQATTRPTSRPTPRPTSRPTSRSPQLNNERLIRAKAWRKYLHLGKNQAYQLMSKYSKNQ